MVDVKTLTPVQLRRRVKQLERCLTDVDRWLGDRYNDHRSCGTDKPWHEEFVLLGQIMRRVSRTLRH